MFYDVCTSTGTKEKQYIPFWNQMSTPELIPTIPRKPKEPTRPCHRIQKEAPVNTGKKRAGGGSYTSPRIITITDPLHVPLQNPMPLPYPANQPVNNAIFRTHSFRDRFLALRRNRVAQSHDDMYLKALEKQHEKYSRPTTTNYGGRGGGGGSSNRSSPETSDRAEYDAAPTQTYSMGSYLGCDSEVIMRLTGAALWNDNNSDSHAKQRLKGLLSCVEPKLTKK
eukprot:PhF_6_TR3312/c0_g1_i3/m.4675